MFRTLFALALGIAPAGPTERGDKMMADYFAARVRELESRCLTEPITRAQWEKVRPALRRQYFEMLGLWPLPERTDLKPQITGRVETANYTVEKLTFQSMPGLYVTANFYLPKPAPTRAATILYLCGHANVVKDGVSFGSKVHYQYHPAWFATQGYPCLILDTLQFSEIPGIHHGLYRFNYWHWLCQGYTPAGIECWNAMRALDYLESRPEVDRSKIGVTGRSGGGASTWWLAAADDRPAVFVPVAGIADLRAHLVEGEAARFKTSGVLPGHCDCMYFLNTYQWDFPLVAALAAPRPLLLGNTDVDDIFPVGGYRRLAEKVKKVYAAYGAEERFQLLEEKGPHKDTPELRRGINAWMNKWLRNRTDPPTDELPPNLTPEQLRVLTARPGDARNETIHDSICTPPGFPLPKTSEEAAAWMRTEQPKLVRFLNDQVFRNDPASPVPTLQVRAFSSVDGIRTRTWEYESEPGIGLECRLVAVIDSDPTRLDVEILDETSLQAFPPDKKTIMARGGACLFIIPRGYGETRWAEDGSRKDIEMKRRYAYIGRTVDQMRIWDARQALAAVRKRPEFAELPITLRGSSAETSGIALYVAIRSGKVDRLDLTDLPASHRTGPILLNILRGLDIPQALLLVEAEKIILRGTPNDAWKWPLEVDRLLGRKRITIGN